MDTLNNIANKNIIVIRLIAFWGFSEAILGSILNLYRVPFTGLVLGSISIICITLIAKFSGRSKEILRGLIIVILIKVICSPYQAINSYLALIIQGFLGSVFLSFNKYFKTATFIFALLASLSSGIQKILVLTLFYGTSIWRAFDDFFKFILEQFNLKYASQFFAIYFYLIIYLVSGIISGIIAINIYEWISNFEYLNEYKQFRDDYPEVIKKENSAKKFFSYFILLLFILISSLNFSPRGEDKNILMVILRPLIVISIWYYFFTPIFRYFMNKYLHKKNNKHLSDVNFAISHFKNLKAIVKSSYMFSSRFGRFKRIKIFVTTVFFALTLDYDDIP